MGVKSRGCHRGGLLKNRAAAHFRISTLLESADLGQNVAAGGHAAILRPKMHSLFFRGRGGRGGLRTQADFNTS